MTRSRYDQQPGCAAKTEEHSCNEGDTKAGQEGDLSGRECVGCPAGNWSSKRHGHPEGHEEDGEPELYIVFRDAGAVDEGEREDGNDGAVEEAICEGGNKGCKTDEAG